MVSWINHFAQWGGAAWSCDKTVLKALIRRGVLIRSESHGVPCWRLYDAPAEVAS